MSFRRAPGRGALTALLLFAAGGAAAPAQTATTTLVWPPASPARLPRWRGFNLVEKLNRDWSNGPYHEEDFRLIARFGFNFVRLPLDYRIWTRDEADNPFDEQALTEIDQAVRWGERYGLHVCLCLHRAPGYCVTGTPEDRDLWTDPATQQACARQWAMLARRYRGIPSDRLSFNLINEPPAYLPGADYARVLSVLVDAIRREDPDRLLIADGLQYALMPCRELVPLRVAQATRGYVPLALSHYRAPWVPGSEDMPVPTWPVASVNAYLYGPVKRAFASPLVIDGPFPAALALRVRVGAVSTLSRLVVRADEQVVLDARMKPGPGEGDWEKAVFNDEWHCYQNVYNRDYTGVVPAGAHRITIENTEGDWLTLTAVGLRPAGDPPAAERVLKPGLAAWGAGQTAVRYDADRPDAPFRPQWLFDRETLWREYVEPWRRLQAEGVGVMVGEWGAYRAAPHAVVLRWMEDCLRNWRAAGIGWALWNFRGDFGVMDSKRADVPYEDFEGHRLDRAMLELLQKY